MKRLHIFIIKSFLGPFFMTFFICIFVLLMQFLWKHLDDLVGKGLPLHILGEFFVYAIASLVPMALMLAVLLASLMTFGNLGEHYELIALKAAGISLYRIMRPLIIFAALLSIGAFFFANNVLPSVNLKLYSLMLSLRSQNPEMVIKEGIFNNDIPNFSIKVDKFIKERNILKGVMIYDHRNQAGNNQVILADSGRMEMTADKMNMLITLYRGVNYSDIQSQKTLVRKNYPFAQGKFKEQVILFPVSGFSFNRMDENLLQGFHKMLSIRKLTIQEDSLEKVFDKRVKGEFATNLHYGEAVSRRLYDNIRPDTLKKKNEFKFVGNPNKIADIDNLYNKLSNTEKIMTLESSLSTVRNNMQELIMREPEILGSQIDINKLGLEWHRKFSWSFACLIFFFIGAPLGAIIRKGGFGMPVVISVLMFILYYIVSMTGEKFAREGMWAVWDGMWLSTFIFMPFGVFLTYKAVNDSGMMSSEVYLEYLKKINNFLKEKRKHGFFKKENSTADQ
ncbi:MAG: LptF/LptG family permease [Bacteroidota bacterium]|nr:LptF/LptG family permease [Bacteroidota bacterium]MDP4205654.1 LptF/LptG family permease [Bacteroidota bacterium]